MSNVIVKRINPVITEDGESYFECYVNNNRVIDITFSAFYDTILPTDGALELHSLMFETWEDLTTDLLDGGYAFEARLTDILQRWSDKQIAHHSRPIDGEDEEVDEELADEDEDDLIY
jgi:hypothetical protein